MTPDFEILMGMLLLSRALIISAENTVLSSFRAEALLSVYSPDAATVSKWLLMNFEFVLPPVTRIEYFALEIWLPLKILLLVLDPSTTMPRSPFSTSIVLVENVL